MVNTTLNMVNIISLACCRMYMKDSSGTAQEGQEMHKQAGVFSPA